MSTTDDPESGYLMHEGKPEDFFYLEHHTVDHKMNVVTDVHVSAGNVHDTVSYLSRLKHQLHKFNWTEQIEAVALDAGYLSTHICHALRQMKIFAVTGGEAFYPKKRIDEQKNVYVCPTKHELRYATTSREGFQSYVSNPHICQACPLLDQCTHAQKKQKLITRHVWEESKEWVRRNLLRGRQNVQEQAL